MVLAARHFGITDGPAVVSVVDLVVGELKANGGRVLVTNAKAPLRRVVKPRGIVVDVRETNEGAPLVVPLLVGFHKPPL